MQAPFLCVLHKNLREFRMICLCSSIDSSIMGKVCEE